MTYTLTVDTEGRRGIINNIVRASGLTENQVDALRQEARKWVRVGDTMHVTVVAE